MYKTVVINVGSGNLYDGFPRITAQLWTAADSFPEQFVGSLPPDPSLIELCHHWQLSYRCLCYRLPVRSMRLVDDDVFEIDEDGITNVSQSDFDTLCQQLRASFNTWLNSREFLNIERQLRSQLAPTEDIRVIIETDNEWLWRLPWHQWDWLQDYPRADIAFSGPEYKRPSPSSLNIFRSKIRILAILGNSKGIDLQAETQFLQSLPDAEITFLVNPSRQEFNQQLWSQLGWDILFFAGHSQTEGKTGRIYINENPTSNSLTIEQLEEGLKAAIEQGLKLAIFNSCDGLGLAMALEKLHIPAVIVMREPVPNYVAQEFFDHFLEDFVCEHSPLYLSIRRSRRKLQGLEDDFPGASWLPVLCQNPVVEPPTWLQLSNLSPEPQDDEPQPEDCTHGLTQEHQQWEQTVDVSVFYGREQELTKLECWVLQDRCKLISILGMGGIGKTTLSVKLAKNIQHDFDYLIWRSLDHAPHIDDLLTEMVQFLSNQQEIHLPETIAGKLSRLLYYLKKQRCLIVLDNVESILQGGISTGSYIPGYEDYGYLFKQVGECQHDSCILLTSREKPKEIAVQESETSRVRSLLLTGLTQTAAQAIFQAKGCSGIQEQDIQQIVEHYAGNPLALKMVASSVQELFEGNVAELIPYVKQGSLRFEDINDLLERQFNRLSGIEQQVMYWLAVNFEPVSLSELEADTMSEAIARRLPEALKSLGRRCLIERSKNQWFLQPVVMEHVLHRLVVGVCEEIIDGRQVLLRNYALLKAQSKDYIRQSQIRKIIQPLIDELLVVLGSQVAIEHHLKAILTKLKAEAPLQPGYVAGNILNLLCYLKADLKNLDFSNLTVWQAYLVGVNLHQVNFAHADLSQSVITDTLSATLSVAFSPDGKLFATGNADGEVRIWQTADGKKLLSFQGHTSWIWSVAFSPDGQTLASGGNDQTIKLWSIATGECLKTLSGHTNWVWSVTFSPNGQTLASGSNDHTIKLWNIFTGECLKTLKEHTDAVCSVAFSPDGKALLSSSDDHLIKLWDTTDGKCLKTLQGHTGWVRTVAFSPDGQTIISGSHDSTIRLWDLSTEQCLKVLKGHSSYVLSIAFHPNGQMIATGSHDSTIRLWDLSTEQCLKILQGHPNGVWSIAFHPNGKTLISGSNDSTIKLWKTCTGQSIRTLQGYSAGVKAVAFSPDGQLIASGGDDKIIKLWDTQSGNCLKKLSGHLSWIWSTLFSPNGQILASSSSDSTIRLWDVKTGQSLTTLQGHGNLVISIAFSPDGQILASGSIDQTIRLWNVQSGQCRKVLSDSGRIWSVCFSPDGTFLASAGENQVVKLWNIQSGECTTTFQGHTGLILSATFSPDGQTLASASSDQTIRLWDVQSKQCAKTLSHSGRIWSVSFNSDGTVLASASEDRTVKLWDVQSGHCLKTLQAHSSEVWSTTFHPQKPLLASGSQDGTIRLWNVVTGECVSTLRDQRPYEQMNIIGVTGLTEAQKTTLKALGAVC